MADQTNQGSRPKIVYLMSDDHACRATSAYCYGLNQTPNIDKQEETVQHE